MIQRALLALAVLAALSSGRSVAADPDLQVAATAVAENSVSISIHNSDSASETTRITMSVQLSTGAEQTLTSSNVTVAGGATVFITLSAAQTIVAIGDDPEPIPPTFH
jgi:sensor domain CHASE-containing protein